MSQDILLPEIFLSFPVEIGLQVVVDSSAGGFDEIIVIRIKNSKTIKHLATIIILDEWFNQNWRIVRSIYFNDFLFNSFKNFSYNVSNLENGSTG